MNSWKIFIIFMGLFSFANTKSSFVVLKAPKCENYNRNYIGNLSVVFKGNKLSVDIDLIKTLFPGFRMNMDFFSRKSQSASFSNFYQYSLDVCRMLAMRKNNIFKIWFSKFFQYGNFQKSCPVQQNNYYLRDFEVTELDVPTFLYAGYYRLQLRAVQSYSQSKAKDFIVGCDVEVEIK